MVRRLVELGRAARAESGMKTRQPLARALVAAPGWATLPDDLRDQIRDELNVVALANLADTGELVELSVKPNFRRSGVASADQRQPSRRRSSRPIRSSWSASCGPDGARVLLDGEPVELEADDVVVSETPRSGWAVSTGGPDTVALDLELTHELRLLGLIRDVVRFVQEARKDAGLDVTDRIELGLAGRRIAGGRPTRSATHRAPADPRGAGPGAARRAARQRVRLVRGRRRRPRTEGLAAPH